MWNFVANFLRHQGSLSYLKKEHSFVIAIMICLRIKIRTETMTHSKTEFLASLNMVKVKNAVCYLPSLQKRSSDENI